MEFIDRLFDLIMGEGLPIAILIGFGVPAVILSLIRAKDNSDS